MDEAIDFVGLLASLHGILGIVYAIWYQRIAGKKPPPTAATKPTTGATPTLALMNSGIADPYDVSDIIDEKEAPTGHTPTSTKAAKKNQPMRKQLDDDDPKKRFKTSTSHRGSQAPRRWP